MKWKVPDQEVDQRGLGDRSCKKYHQAVQARKLNKEDAMDCRR